MKRHRRFVHPALWAVLLCTLFLPGLFAEELSLTDAVTGALNNSGQLSISEWEVKQKEFALDEVKAKRLPTVDLQSTVTLMSNPQEGITISKGELGYQPSFESEAPIFIPDQDYILMEDYEHTYFKTELTLDQPIFSWGKLKQGADLARGEVRAAEADRKVTEAEVRKQTVNAYYGIVFSRRAVDYLRQARELQEQMVEDRENEYSEGVINLQTLLETKRNRAQLETALAEVARGGTQAERGFQMLTGVDPSTFTFTTTLEEGIEPPADKENIVGAGLENSPQVRTVAVSAELAEDYQKMEEISGQLRPDFFLRLGMDITGQRVPFIQANWTDTWDVNFLVTLGGRLTLWDSGASAARRKKAAAQAWIAREGYRQTIDSARMSIEIAAEALHLAFLRIQEKEAETALVREQLKNARVSFENDLLTRWEMLGAEMELINAEVELLTSRLNYHQARAELEYLTGDYLSSPDGQFSSGPK